MSYTLRDYQQKAVDDVMDYLQNNEGNPCLVLPTGSGKSLTCAEICKHIVDGGGRVIVISHRKEILDQNKKKLMMAMPTANIGVYSAGLGRKEFGQITFAGIQSLVKAVDFIPIMDIVIIDECHLVPHSKDGSYHKVLNSILTHNPDVRVIGLTATPYRLGHGIITDGNTVFDDLVEPTSIMDLVEKGYLTTLKSKCPPGKIDLSGCKVAGGEYVLKDLDRAINVNEHNVRIATDIIARAEDRSKWILFCSGVKHAEEMTAIMNGLGIKSACVTGKTPPAQRNKILADFQSGGLKCLMNSDVLTIGFDAPDIDLLAMIRATLSPALFVQILGRAMRPKSHTDHALILDYVGNIATHGPITDVQPPRGKKGAGEAPVKVCPECFECMHTSIKKCKECGYEFPTEDRFAKMKLHNDNVMGREPETCKVIKWHVSHKTSRKGNDMIVIKYILVGNAVPEYLQPTSGGFSEKKAMNRLEIISKGNGLDYYEPENLLDLALAIETGRPPKTIDIIKHGKFYTVSNLKWD